MKPYSNLHTHNLGFLLFAARFTAIIGTLAVLISFWMFAQLFFTKNPVEVGLGSSIFLTYSIGILLGSGVMAAIVGFEENYRKRTEVILTSSKSEI